MTAEDNARELVNKFRRITNEKGLRAIKLEYAKQCALIAVDEMLKEKAECSKYECYGEDIRFWQEVKNEIEKL